MAATSYALNLGLNDVPDNTLEPEVWQELNKVFNAMKLLADAMDSGVHPGLAGTPGEVCKLQNYAKCYLTAEYDTPPGRLSVVYPTTLKARLAGSTYPYPNLYNEAHISAGEVGEYIILGMVYYADGGLVPGNRYYLNTSNNNGQIQSSPGGRYVGQAFDTHVLFFDPKTQ